MDRGRDEENEELMLDIIGDRNGEDDGSQYLNLSAGDEEDQRDEEGQTNSADDEEGQTNSDDGENVGSLTTKSSEVYYTK